MGHLTENEKRTFKRMIDRLTQTRIEEKMKQGIAPDLKWMNRIDFQWHEKEEPKPVSLSKQTKRDSLRNRLISLFSFKKKQQEAIEPEPETVPEEIVWGPNVISIEELRKNRAKSEQG